MFRYDHDVVEERKCDTFFIKFKYINKWKPFDYDAKCVAQQIAWCNDWGITVEKVWYQGLILGDSGYYYVGFESIDDATCVLWRKLFENDNGESLQPDKYTMILYTHDMYLKKKQDGEFDPIDGADM